MSNDQPESISVEGDLLRLGEGRWALAMAPWSRSPVVVPIATAVAMAWTRFGGLVFSDIRALVCFILVGVYGWLGLGLLLWLVVLAVRRSRPHEVPDDAVVTPGRFVRISGYAHVPLLITAFGLAFVAGLLDVVFVGIWFLIAGMVLWMPAMVTAGVLHAGAARSPLQAAAIAAGPILLWLLTVGWWMASRLSHFW